MRSNLILKLKRRSEVLMLAGAVSLGATGALVSADRQDAATAEPRRAAAPAVRQAITAHPPLTRTRAALAAAAETPAERSQVQVALASLGKSVRQQSDPRALRMAFQAYFAYKAKNPEQVKKPYLYYVDYGLDSRTPRGYVFDMEALKVIDGPFTVAHGRGSDPRSAGKPTRFANRQGSNSTSLGLYLAQETYAFRGKSGGRAYRSVGLRLKGLSGRFNSAARARGVVAHGAPYVTASRAGRSEGCPAVEPGRAERLLPRLANGGLVFLFSPLDRDWMSEDPWANAEGPANG